MGRAVKAKKRIWVAETYKERSDIKRISGSPPQRGCKAWLDAVDWHASERGL
jgi:hypothetical protein